MTRRRDGGFTLVEVLVVMVVLGVLAGIAVPVFLGQRERAERATLSSDLRGLRLAQEARAVDGDYTADVALLRADGFVTSDRVDADVDLAGDEYLACVTHPGVDETLWFDSATGETAWASTACED